MAEPTRTPAQVAQFDQAFAVVDQDLNALIAIYREGATFDGPDLAVVGLGQSLLTYDHEALAERLAVAIRRLADKEAIHD